MTLPFMFGPSSESSIDDLIRASQEMQWGMRGDLYPDWGQPYRWNAWNGLNSSAAVSSEYANVFGIGEPTFGRSFQVYDGVSNIGLQVDNDGLYGELPFAFQDDGVVEGNLEVGSDLLVQGDTVLNGTLSVADDADFAANVTIDQTLLVTGTSTFSDDVSMLAELTVALDALFQANVEIDDELLVHGPVTFEDTLTQEGTAEFQDDVDFQALVTFDDDLAVATNLLFADVSARTVSIGTTGAAPLIFAEETTDFVGIRTATPLAPLDVAAGPIRVGGTSGPSGGEGLELHWNAGTNTATILPFDRTGGAFGALTVNALAQTFQASSSTKFAINGTGVGWFGTAPVAQQAGDGGGSTADTTWGALERDMLQVVYDAMYAYGLLVG